MHESKKGKKKGKRGPFCAPRKHNAEATSHDAEHCLQLHLEQRPNSGFKSSSNGPHPPTTKLVEVNNGHESEISLLLTEAASKPIVLDSRATHHLINNPDTFQPTSDSNIKITTGGHKNFLNATAVGIATLVNHLGERIVLKNALLVPTLTRSLISIPRLFKDKLLIIKTTNKGATIVIDNKYKLLGSMKNNLLELHSAHFELINSSSSCYQLSSNSPNWHACLGHPNPKYQSVMMPNSKYKECAVCKECTLKTLPFTGKFKPVKKTFEAVHMDLVGPLPVRSPGGFVYFLTIINQFSGYRTVKFLRNKLETFVMIL
ncbi:uncharacterized protein VP01_4111g1 [Puccinia sorghi]|uniref:Retrovirus-related Pol polyprotein from transposon TNT 1-94-like beta-barrel domain-containing protein n=1 Tax=Puccinia sorghi TaxID=27349 RepID=A0A0L6UR83_9BASI|nr:uncharacterized protein VP01_4111g1 [Puccinia sorghi]